MTIDPTISEWLNLIFRWIHVFAGIMWVGTTYYFTWLDARLSEEERSVAASGGPAQIWMVHSRSVAANRLLSGPAREWRNEGLESFPLTKVSNETQPNILALLRVKLTGKHIVVPNAGRE